MAAASTLAHRYAREPFGSESNSSWSPSPPPKAKVAFSNASRQRKTLRITACKATDERVIKDDEVAPTGEFEKHEGHPPRAGVSSRAAAQRSARKEVERTTYLVAAIMSSLGISSLAVVSIYYRFSWQMEVRQKLLMILVKLFGIPYSGQTHFRAEEYQSDSC